MAKNTDQPIGGMSDVAAQTTHELRSFTSTLQNLEGGELVQDLTDKQKEVIDGIVEAEASRGGKPSGELNIKIKYKLDGGVMEVRTDITTKIPKVERRKSIMWVTPEGNLTPRNPKQGDLPFRAIESPPMRTITDEVGTKAVRAV